MARPWCGRTLPTTTAVIIILVATFSPAQCRYSEESEFTIAIPAGKDECFHQPAKKGQTLEIEFQVLDSGSVLDEPTLNVDFSFFDPQNRILTVDTDKMDGVYRFRLSVDGDFKICLSNRRSLISAKLVYLEVFLDKGDVTQDEVDDDPFDLGSVTLAAERHFNSSQVDKLKERLNRLYDLLNTIERYQEWQKAHEARHRNLVEHNFTKVNTLSCLLTCLMILTGFVRVMFIRGLFEDRPSVYQVLTSLKLKW
ncbi:transmembrane emp24 domain-containing protein 1-like [Tropilaelaps mercedesae]|uniref:Transmembrane emp24 domain-containing protein 1-like n=1 Tax=Tropilaelaps mercedesae TaxID=418985 RepID=A0A1V9XP94_9ACAR|nr:transmembrane emp24 domain-containing protein 1-like [Tropilaelaps mercedesae]